MAQKRKHSPTPSSQDAAADNVFRSEPIDDRSSTFIGYFSPKLPAKDLQNLAEIDSASHKILAWRKESNQRSLTLTKVQYDVGHDDDGEKYGGKRVEKVLESMQVVGACVVARWYGGVMLGPVRFNHMETCAREAVQRWLDYEDETRTKKRRVVQDAAEHEKLVKSLADRDQSISVLRVLAAEKEEKVKTALVTGMEELQAGDSKSQQDAVGEGLVKKATAAPAAKPALDYSAMPIDRLRALDKARDATLSFLLKRIDKAEADWKALSEPEKPP